MNGQARDKRLEDAPLSDVYPENDLVRWLRQGTDAIRPHLMTIAAVVAALLCLWGYFVWRKSADAAARSAAWNEFFAEDYEAVIAKHGNTDVARFARMRIAENALQEGKSLVLSKRSDALKAFEKAELQLDSVIADTGAPADMRRTAMFLKGMTLEAGGAPEKAKEQYSKLAAQYRDSQEARVAEARVKDLSRKSAADFYRQLANYKPGDRPALPPPVTNSNSLDDLLRGLENPNLPIASPPPVKDAPKAAPTATPVKKEEIPSPPPPKKTPDAPPGKELPKDDKKSAKEEKPATPPTKPAEPPKK